MKKEKIIKIKQAIEQGKLKKAAKQSTILRFVQYTSMALIIIAIIMSTLVINADIRLNQLNVNKMTIIDSLHQLSQDSAYLSSETRAYALNLDPQRNDSYIQGLAKWNQSTAKYNDLKKFWLNDEENRILDGFKNTAQQLRETEKMVLSETDKDRIKDVVALVTGSQYSNGVELTRDLSARISKLINQRYNASIAQAEKETEFLRILGMISGSLAVIIQGICLLYVMLKLMNPVKKIYREMIEISQGNLSSHFDMKRDTSEIGTLAHSIHETKDFLKRMIDDISNILGNMSKGNYNQEVTADYIGEFAQIKESLNIILNSSNTVLSQISQASMQVASGSEQVASGAQALSHGATEQASSIEELSAVITQISDKIRLNAQNAGEANRVTEVASNTLLQSNDQMGQMIGAMAEISEASNEISKIIKTIDDIAFQTNILALNAAVEAARAGAAGKGFAVVAEEVRNLASKSAQAAKTTTDLIEEAIESVENGKHIVDSTAQSLGAVVENAKKAALLINDIAIASNEQAESINQVTQGVDQISGVVQTNSATAEESAAASEELSSQSQLLNSLIEKFELRDYTQEQTLPIETEEHDSSIEYHEENLSPMQELVGSKY
ncbi:methyl-accepting chemotaxis protein [Paludicola sp. MB14-C6]|uniref:methyl-accepting chemotaxis protein n=1 Tax=Paludihabitans sp. MB14-C6 TaxID=3070656 RepID=UPI0027DD84D7|nr:methyl-accepting chemotaxis protein [Paludicola sp. MB14-C6]WMJ22361.1 methyl-accepting chemotaxis protein [Paludicola sp. MB14-C6]